MNFIAIALEGFDVWKSKAHNKKWFKLIDGTPIPNDVAVCIAGAFSNAMKAEAEAKVTPSCGCVYRDLNVPCKNPECEICHDLPKSAWQDMAQDGLELALYASYAEIVGAVSHNRSAIRKYCDKVFEHHRVMEKAEWDRLTAEFNRSQAGGDAENAGL